MERFTSGGGNDDSSSERVDEQDMTYGAVE